MLGLLLNGKSRQINREKLILLPLLMLVCLFNFSSFTVSGFLSLIIIIYYIANEPYKIILLDRIRNLYALLLLISIIEFIFIVYLRLDVPYNEILPANVNKNSTYLQYPLLVVINNPRLPIQYFRYCFIFDEPGVVGTVASMLLVSERYRMDKWQNIIIAISGVLSFSLFFFVISLLYMLFYHLHHLFNWKFLLVIITVSAFFATYESDVFDVKRLIVHRLEFGDDGKLSGDNRSNAVFDAAYANFWRDGGIRLLTGKGVGAHARIAPDIQTYKMVIYDQGIIYVLLSIVFYAFYSFVILKRQYKDYCLYIIFILIFYYQRPAYFFQYGEFYLLTLIPYALKNRGTITQMRKHTGIHE